MSAIASAIVCAVKFVNLFARRQHQYDIAAKPTDFDLIDIDSNILVFCCLVPSSKMKSYNLLMVVTTSSEFH